MDPLRAAQPFVGVPYVLHGRDPTGWDCWGCVRWVRRAVFGLDSPCWGEVYADEAAGRADLWAALIAERLDAWTECEPKPGAVALIGRLGVEGHVGLMLTRNDLIHVERDSLTVVARRDAGPLLRRSFRFFETR